MQSRVIWVRKDDDGREEERYFTGTKSELDEIEANAQKDIRMHWVNNASKAVAETRGAPMVRDKMNETVDSVPAPNGVVSGPPK